MFIWSNEVESEHVGNVGVMDNTETIYALGICSDSIVHIVDAAES